MDQLHADRRLCGRHPGAQSRHPRSDPQGLAGLLRHHAQPLPAASQRRDQELRRESQPEFHGSLGGPGFEDAAAEPAQLTDMNRRFFLAALAALLPLPGLARAATSVADAQKYIDSLGEAAISSLTGSTLSETEREDRFRSLLESHFNLS